MNTNFAMPSENILNCLKENASNRQIGKYGLNPIHEFSRIAAATFARVTQGYGERSEKEGEKGRQDVFSTTLARAYRSVTERVRRRRMKNYPVRRGLVDHRGSTGTEWQE